MIIEHIYIFIFHLEPWTLRNTKCLSTRVDIGRDEDVLNYDIIVNRNYTSSNNLSNKQKLMNS